jgi:hypothetical protein
MIPCSGRHAKFKFGVKTPNNPANSHQAFGFWNTYKVQIWSKNSIILQAQPHKIQVRSEDVISLAAKPTCSRLLFVPGDCFGNMYLLTLPCASQEVSLLEPSSPSSYWPSLQLCVM